MFPLRTFIIGKFTSLPGEAIQVKISPITGGLGLPASIHNSLEIEPKLLI